MRAKFLVIGAALIPFVVGCAVDPHRYTTPSVPPDSSPTVPRTPVPTLHVVSPLPNEKPTLFSQTIFVVGNPSSKWKLQEVIKGWSPAKWTEFQLAESCPTQWFNPCVTIQEVKQIPGENVVGETEFSTHPNKMIIRLDSDAKMSGHEAQTTLCHEFGHVLGLPHVKGRRDTCMYDGNYYRKYPLIPTKLDLSLADSYGQWEVEKMYELSGKTVDLRPAPK